MLNCRRREDAFDMHDLYIESRENGPEPLLAGYLCPEDRLSTDN